MKFLVSLIVLALFVMTCKADDAAAANDQQQPPPDVTEEELQIMDKRIPHPSWRSGRIQHFQQGEMPPLTPRRFMSNGPRRFYRYARRPFSLDFVSDW